MLSNPCTVMAGCSTCGAKSVNSAPMNIKSRLTGTNMPSSTVSSTSNAVKGGMIAGIRVKVMNTPVKSTLDKTVKINNTVEVKTKELPKFKAKTKKNK